MDRADKPQNQINKTVLHNAAPIRAPDRTFEKTVKGIIAGKVVCFYLNCTYFRDATGVIFCNITLNSISIQLIGCNTDLFYQLTESL